MNLRFPALGLLLFTFCIHACALVAQNKDPGQKYAEMSDAELWAEVEKCKDRKELRTLINQIPIAVISQQSILCLEEPLKDHRFGKMINRVLWTDAYAERQKKKLLRLLHWQDSSRKFERHARILDVQESRVKLQEEDGKSYWVETNRLSRGSLSHIGYFQRIRRDFVNRIPVDVAQLIAHEEDFGQQYSKMNGAELWNKVIACKNRSELKSLIRQIPISVQVNHSITTRKTKPEAPGFGELMERLLRAEFKSDKELERLFKITNWKDVEERYEVEAAVFDVGATSVILQKKDKRLFEVPFKSLSASSISLLETYQRLAERVIQRIPDDKDQLFSLMNDFGEQYAVMSDARLWALVEKC